MGAQQIDRAGISASLGTFAKTERAKRVITSGGDEAARDSSICVESDHSASEKRQKYISGMKSRLPAPRVLPVAKRKMKGEPLLP
jgi:hypothetical protein